LALLVAWLDGGRTIDKRILSPGQINTCKDDWFSVPISLHISLTFQCVIAIGISGFMEIVFRSRCRHLAGLCHIKLQLRDLAPCSQSSGVVLVSLPFAISPPTGLAQHHPVSFNPTSLESYTCTASYRKLEPSVPHYTSVRQHAYRRDVPATTRKGCYWL